MGWRVGVGAGEQAVRLKTTEKTSVAHTTQVGRGLSKTISESCWFVGARSQSGEKCQCGEWGVVLSNQESECSLSGDDVPALTAPSSNIGMTRSA